MKKFTTYLPVCWEDCYAELQQQAEMHMPDKNCFEYLDQDGSIEAHTGAKAPLDDIERYKTDVPMGYARKLLALSQLLVCREVYCQGWKPNWANKEQNKYAIMNVKGEATRLTNIYVQAILAFPTAKIRDKFYTNFKDLIDEAKDLI